MRVHGHADNYPRIDESDEEVAHLELLVSVAGVAIDEEAELDPLGQEADGGLVEVVVGGTGALLPSAAAVESDFEVRLVEGGHEGEWLVIG